jgi:hypothetical protein
MTPKPWPEMSPSERSAAVDMLTQVVMDGVRGMLDDLNAELADEGYPLRLRGSLSVRWEKQEEQQPG